MKSRRSRTTSQERSVTPTGKTNVCQAEYESPLGIVFPAT